MLLNSYQTAKYRDFLTMKKVKNDSIKREISTVMAIVNPEINNILPNIFTKTAIAIIKEYSTDKDPQQATPKKLCKVFRNIKGNNFNEEKAKSLIALSKNLIYLGCAKSARSLMITTNINILELIIQEKILLEHEIKILIENNQDENFINGVENLKTIPGVADKTISAILGECGDLRR